MKKVMIGVAAVGAAIGLRQVAKRGGQTMREHCEQMMGQCAGQGEATCHEAMTHAMTERHEQMARDRGEPVAAA